MDVLVRLRVEQGVFVARAEDYPDCVGRGPSGPEAVEQLRSAITYWLEICPCAHAAAEGLTLRVVSGSGGRARAG